MVILPALWLPIMFKCKLDLLGEDISDEGFVVGAILPLHLHQQLVIHAVLLLLLPACSSLSPFYTLNFLKLLWLISLKLFMRI